MHAQRFFCIAALVLFAASLVLVATDQVVMRGTEHQPGQCPVCSWANCLATAVLPAIAVWLAEQTVDRPPHEPVRILAAEFIRPSSRSRAPPASRRG